MPHRRLIAVWYNFRMNRIKEARLAAGLSVAELARRVEMAPSNVSAIENGNRAASSEMAERLLAATGCPSAVLRKNRANVIELIAQSGCKEPRIFGSVARGEDLPGSDIDLLVKYERGNSKAFCALPRRISELLRVPVDVISEGGLRPTDTHILAEAIPLWTHFWKPQNS